MQEPIDQHFLPNRNTRQLGAFQRSEPRRFVTNYYDVKVQPNLSKVYVYEAKFPPEIPSDSSQIFIRCIQQLKAELRTSIGFLCYSGRVVYGTKENKISMTHQCKIEGNPIEVQLKLIKDLDVMELLHDRKTRPSVFQFLNSKLKSCMRNANICELGKAGQFYQKDQLLKGFKKEMAEQYSNLERAGLNVLRGYKFTLAMINNKLKLQLDVCSRVLQRNNLQQDFLDFVGTTEELSAFYKGATVITRYGNYRTYKIQQIDFRLSPSSTFEHFGQQVTFQQYYKKAYNADIYDIKQPLIKVLAQTKKHINKNQSIKLEQQFIYLVPELVSLTGMKDEQRANFESMRALAPFTKLSPMTRFEESYKVLDTLNEAKDIIEIGHEEQMKGYQLEQPTVRFREIANLRSGAIANRGQLFKAHTFVKWVFVYSKFNQADFNEAAEIQNCLRQASVAFGISYKQPFYIEVQSQAKVTAGDFCEQIGQELTSKNIKPEIIFIILKQKQTTFYGLIKNMLTNEFQTPCQIIQSKSLNRGKNILSVASKIAIQMSCKAGDAPWIIQNRLAYFNKRNFATAGLASSKGKGGYTIAFVGTTNNQCSDVYSNYVIRVPKKQKIDGIILKNWFKGWIKSYYMKNNALPETLLFYRQSVGDSLLRAVLPHQIDALKDAIADVKKKAKKPTYNPEIIYIVVNKRINSRFFAASSHEVYNPEPGSIVVEEMTSDNRFDFHLVAQKVTQGTSTPTHYVIAYDSSKIPQEELIRFTYEQCYNYYNWQGSVKVPACLQLANKLSKLAGESIQRPLLEPNPVCETFYFL